MNFPSGFLKEFLVANVLFYPDLILFKGIYMQYLCLYFFIFGAIFSLVIRSPVIKNRILPGIHLLSLCVSLVDTVLYIQFKKK